MQASRPKLTVPEDHIEWLEWTPSRKGIFPEFRLGARWYNVAWLLLPAVIAGVIMHVGGVWFLETDAGRWLIATYPGTVKVPVIDAHGFPWWLRLNHLINLVLMLLIIRSGIQILADHPRLYWDRHCTPGSEWFRFQFPVPMNRVWTAKDDAVTLPGWLGIPGGRHTIGPARWVHFSSDMFWVVNGVIFVVLLFFSAQYERLIPRTWDVLPNAFSTVVQYSALKMPLEDGWVRYNALQQLVYAFTVFVAAPWQILTGFAQSPALANRFGVFTKVMNRQAARSLHYMGLLYFIFYIATHVTMVFVTGFKKNFNHIVLNSPADTWTGFLIGMAVLAVIGLGWAAASPWVTNNTRTVQRTGTFLVGWIKSLMEWWNPRMQFRENEISPHFWPNGAVPVSQEWLALQADGFKGFTFQVFGLCENPLSLTFEQLKAMPKQEQTTMHYCIQGWSGVAKWGGVPVRNLLTLAQPKPEVKYVAFYSFGEGGEGGTYYDVHELHNMKHDLTILAYEMNGEPLPNEYGPPLRLRCENELGFKQIKWVQSMEFIADFRQLGAGQGGYNEDREFYGYRVPI